MRRTDQVWLAAVTVLSLSGFSFFAGLGFRGLYERARQDGHGSAQAGLLIASTAAPRGLEPDARPGQLFWDVMQKLRVYYVEQLPQSTALTYGTVEAMLASLRDPNTRLLSKAEVDALQAMGNGNYAGIGAVLTIKPYVTSRGDETPEDEAGARTREGPGIRTLTVVSVLPGSPAEKAGLRSGDRITEIDGRWIAPIHVSYRILTQLTEELGPQDGRPREPGEEPGAPPNDPARDRLRQEANEERMRWKTAVELSSVMVDLTTLTTGERELTVERGRPAKPTKIKVAFQAMRVDPVSFRKIDAQTGYIRILGFSPGAREQVQQALEALKKEGVKNLVVDLRQSPGGNLEVARDVAGLLMGDVRFGVLKERNQGTGPRLVDNPIPIPGAQARLRPARAAVLVDGGTAGPAELLAAALREHLGARLVGATTFGDGTEQELFALGNGTGFTLTRARMLTARGVDFDGKGLKADVSPQGDPVDAAVASLAMPPLPVKPAPPAGTTGTARRVPRR